MSFFRRYAMPLNILVILVTIVFVGASLVVGRAVAAPTVTVEAGLSSPDQYIATRTINVPDDAATEEARQRAYDNEPSVFSVDETIIIGVRTNISAFFEDLAELAFLTPRDLEIEQEKQVLQQTVDAILLERGGVVQVEDTEDTVFLIGLVPDEETRGDLIAALEAIDQRPINDLGLTVDESVAVTSTTSTTTSTTTTEPGDAAATTTTTTTTTTIPEVTTTTLPRRDAESWVERLQEDYPDLQSIPAFVSLYNNDLDRIENGEASRFDAIITTAVDVAENLMADGIRQSELRTRQDQLRGQTPLIFVPALSVEEQALAHPAIGELVADELLFNETVDEALTIAAREAARDAVEPIERTYFANELIASQGELLTQVQVDAILALELVEREPGVSRQAIVILGALTVSLAAFFLWRLAPGEWSDPKHFALLGILLVLAALSSRLPELVDGSDGDFGAVGFAIPAMLFGYVAAILYNPRTGVLLAVPVTTFVAISTFDPALTVFAAVATVAPVAFVSAVSSRRELRVAVALSAVVLTPFAFAISWLFRGWETRWEAAFFGLIGGVLAGLLAQGLVSFLENLFRMTTTLTLLDLVDRNHPALRLIEEKAPGTFNHSMLVGTLAGKAARAIGADPLLSQAAAFYHDLGKVENPVYFIENQFGIPNPHDHLDPIDSCRIIRAHVTDGLRLARQYKLPSEIADGIRRHHGTGLMRYFYHQGVEADPDVDPQLFRHHGEKPKRKEMAILMICDSVEGAARAHALSQTPTMESLEKIVDAVVAEKLDDGQLDESDITFGDLTNIKASVVDALVGYYHIRVPYPGFPGSKVEAQ
ncbi:MAG: HDIG domain-containing protein [Acidimicrobiia bacterium]|nr:HDIG domain-containing protein [Acidimicrobiia bacterium]